ncbi:Rab3 GTPase-activating protein catalytic subunit [Desmophyllum pertusum]|uniref:Rab3 GTPase-activating protein catalytic subunit n=1 Tax=Desmophyllum pertusum TaxID=174260 RepID=A0A9X0A2Y5_9CNID|nr:Rab3 GTPase-activating protein catalytic subunit [Desmophyllum pertusum]
MPISPIPPVTLTVRFTYILDEWTDYSWPQEPPDLSSCLECKVGVNNLGTLPFGACQDPIRELHLSTTWPCLSEEVIVDNSVYSDLDPCHAPQWCVRARMNDNPQCLLGEYLSGYMTLCHRQESTMQLLNKTVMDDDNNVADITHALQRLTEAPHVASLSTAVSRATSRISAMSERSSQEFPIPGTLLHEILKHLFPDADQDLDDLENEQQELLFNKMESNKDAKQEQATQDKFRGLKTAPEESLTFFLAVCICIVYHSYGGLRAVAHLWQEFVLEMRYRWENDIFIPRLKLQPPNLGSCLVHQKLQMLNCCIERKRLSKIRTASVQFSTNMAKNSETRTKSSASVSNSEHLRKSSSSTQMESLESQSSISDDDEFYEAVESQDEADNDSEDNLMDKKSIERTDSDLNEDDVDNNATTCTRQGVKQPFGDLRLLISGEPLMIPVTQEPAPMTEDMLEEHAEILTQLGTSEEGARVRAQMQCASLLSDMEAFKAANPECLLEDFVRWYSPFDWIPGPETEEEVEEVRRLRRERDTRHEESSATTTTAVNSEDSVDEGWDTEDIEVSDETLLSKETSNAKTLMDDAKAGNVEELQPPCKWREEGHLSLRMRIPGNMWVEVWQSARSVPVRRQKRLFDETKEAEKVLHFLAGFKPAQVAFQLFPVLLHAAVLRARDIPAVSSMLNEVLNKASKLSWEMPHDLPRCEEFVKQLQLSELAITRAHSLRFKFQEALSDKGSDGEDKDVEQFLSALTENRKWRLLVPEGAQLEE